MKIAIHPAQCRPPFHFGRLTGAVAALLLLAALCLCRPALAKDVEPPVPRTTVVVFADRPIANEQWAALSSALRDSLSAGEAESLDLNPSILRGDEVEPGLIVETAIVVYLHGDCTLQPLMRRGAFGVPLGWVIERHGHIEPFAHVDCTRIGQVLGPQAMGVNRDRRTEIMASAIAQVILHEWIHIAAQSAVHTHSGIEKAQFGVSDLMDAGGHFAEHPRNPW